MTDRRPAAHRERFRVIFLTIAAALWGMSFALSAIVEFRTPAPPGQLPGIMLYDNLDAAGPFKAALLMIVAPLLFGLAGRQLSRLFVDRDACSWSFVTTISSMIGSAWLARLDPGAGAVLLFPACGVAIALLGRRFDARFEARDVILIPTGLTTYYALVDLIPSWAVALNMASTALIILALRLAVAAVAKNRIPPADAFVVAPLAILLQGWQVRDAIRYNGWLPLIVTIATPLAFAKLLPASAHKTIRRLVTWAILPAAILFYSAALTLNMGGIRGPHVDFFEHGHGLMPASEMLRGRLPYRDFIPGHGLGEDGLLDLLALRTKGVTVGDALELRLMFSSVNAVALYAVAACATGSPEAGYLAAMCATSMLPWGSMFTRSVFAFFALAFAAAALRRRNRRLFMLAGAFAAIQFIYSVDFGMYAAFALGVAVFLSSRFWRPRARSLMSAATGAAFVFVPFAAILIALGVFADFLRVTFVDLPSLASAYTLGFPDLGSTIPEPWSFPEVLPAVLSARALPFLMWPLVVIATASIVALGVSRRTAPLIVVGSYVCIAVLSYAERQHPYYAHGLPLFIMIGIVYLWRIRNATARAFAVALIALTVVAASITPHILLATFTRMSHSTIDSNWTDMWDVPRARHALFWRDDVRRFRALRDWMKSNLRPQETFFDFSNVPILYFLLDRRAPIRQYEVPFYETDDLQREVIARLSRDTSVRAALIAFPVRNLTGSIDGIPNAERTPLVWKYLQTHFRPEFSGDGVEVWVRK